MNDYDKAGRRAEKEDPPNFFDWLLPGFLNPIRFTDWHDARQLPFPGEKDRYCDTVGAFADPSGNRWAVVVELLSEAQGLMLPRMFDYAARLYLELQQSPDTRGTSVAAAVLDLTGPPQPDAIDMRLPGTAGGMVGIKIIRRTMRDESAAATLDGIEAGTIGKCLLSWIPLMSGADDSGIIDRWVRMAEAEPDTLRKAQWGALALTFAELAGRTDAWQRGLKEFNVTKSMFLEGFRQEGRIKGLREGVVDALENRFGKPVPAKMISTLDRVEDVTRLKALGKTALTADSLEVFQAALGD